MSYYRARWGAPLIVITVVATCLLLGVSANGAWMWWKGERMPGVLVSVVPSSLVALCALFTVRGYTITRNNILVHRLLWATRLSRADILSVSHEPGVMRSGLRLFGNGGLFSFSGLYTNRRLGMYRAYATNLRDTVVIRYPGRTVVLSPEAPQVFVREALVD